MATFGRTDRKLRDTAPENPGIAGDKVTNDLNDVLPPDLQPDKPAEDKPAEDKPARNYTRVDLTTFTLDMVAAEPLAEDELAAPPVTVTVTERSAVQMHVDAQFADAYLGWENAGKPTSLRDIYAHDRAVLAKFKAAGEDAPHTQLIVRRFFLDPAQEPGFRKLIRAAAALHGRSVKILPVSQHTSGRHMLVWMPRDMREKKGATNAAAAPAE